MHQIRAANSTDAEALAQVGAATFALACYEGTPQDDIDSYITSELTTTKFQEHIACPSKSIVVATLDSRVCGYLMLCREEVPDELTAQRPLELRRIYVLPEQQGSGIASDLIMCAISEAAAGGHDSLWLSVAADNQRALGFYRRHGFTTTGPCYFPLGDVIYQGLLMTRNMSPKVVPPQVS